MKKIRTAGALVALLAVVGLAPAAAASGHGRDVPFKGTVSGELQFLPAPDCPTWGLATTAIDVPGVASHLGRITMSSRHCSPAGADFGPGTMTFTAANGDQLFSTYSGSAPFPGPGTDIVHGTSHNTITGGTGRFEHATGYFDQTAAIQFQGFDDFSWPATWTWTGVIHY